MVLRNEVVAVQPQQFCAAQRPGCGHVLGPVGLCEQARRAVSHQAAQGCLLPAPCPVEACALQQVGFPSEVLCSQVGAVDLGAFRPR